VCQGELPRCAGGDDREGLPYCEGELRWDHQGHLAVLVLMPLRTGPALPEPPGLAGYLDEHGGLPRFREALLYEKEAVDLLR